MNTKLKIYLWILFISLFLTLLFIETIGFYHADLILYGMMILSFYFNYLSIEFKKPFLKHLIPSIFFLIGISIYALLLVTDQVGHGTGGMILLAFSLILMIYFILHLILNQILKIRSIDQNKQMIDQRLLLILFGTLAFFHFFPGIFSGIRYQSWIHLFISLVGAEILFLVTLRLSVMFKIKIKHLVIGSLIISFILYRFLYRGQTTLIIFGSVLLFFIFYLIRDDLKKIIKKLSKKEKTT